MLKNDISLYRIPLILFVLVIVGLLFTSSSVRAANGDQAQRVMDFWTSHGYKDFTVLPSGDNEPSLSEIVQLTSNVECELDPTDMVSHWPLDDGPGATTFKDVFGGHDGTCEGASCPAATTGKVGGAFSFTSSDNDSISVPTSTDFDWLTTDSFSVGVWVKTNQVCTGNKVFIGRYRQTTPNGTWWVGCAADEADSEVGVAVFRLRDSNLNPRQVNGTSKINDGQWHYIVGVRDGVNDENRLYVDGVLENTMDVNDRVYTGHFASDLRLTMSSYDQPQDYYYQGKLDEAVIYDRALPVNEINSYFNACIILTPNIYLPLILR